MNASPQSCILGCGRTSIPLSKFPRWPYRSGMARHQRKTHHHMSYQFPTKIVLSKPQRLLGLIRSSFPRLRLCMFMFAPEQQNGDDGWGSACSLAQSTSIHLLKLYLVFNCSWCFNIFTWTSVPDPHDVCLRAKQGPTDNSARPLAINEGYGCAVTAPPEFELHGETSAKVTYR